MTEQTPEERDARVGGNEYDRDRATDLAARELVRNKRRKQSLAQLFAYLLIVVIGLYGFYQQDKNADERCKSGNELRASSRANVLAIYDLGVALTTPPIDAPPTPEGKELTQALTKQLTDFRNTQLSAIPPDRTCDQDGWFF